MSQEEKIAEAERQAAEQAEQIYNQQQKEGGAPISEPEAGIGGVEEAPSQPQPQLSPEEEKKQLRAELAKASAENEAQQKANLEQQKQDAIKKQAEESKALDAQYQKGKLAAQKASEKPQSIAQKPPSPAASDLVKAVVSRRLAKQKENKAKGLPADFGMVQTNKESNSILDEAKRNEEIAKNVKNVEEIKKPAA